MRVPFGPQRGTKVPPRVLLPPRTETAPATDARTPPPARCLGSGSLSPFFCGPNMAACRGAARDCGRRSACSVAKRFRGVCSCPRTSNNGIGAGHRRARAIPLAIVARSLDVRSSHPAHARPRGAGQGARGAKRLGTNVANVPRNPAPWLAATRTRCWPPPPGFPAAILAFCPQRRAAPPHPVRGHGF